MLGTDPATPFQGTTDARGQLTFSDMRLAGAQLVTAFKEGYDAITVTSVRAENLTVFLRRIGSEANPGDPPVSRDGRHHGPGARVQAASAPGSR